MFKSFLSAALAAALSASPLALAQAGAPRPDPMDDGSAVPALIYDSSFARYRPFAEQEVSSWRETNDTAGRIGGWRAYAREARQPESAGSGPAAPPVTKPAPADAAKPMSGAHSMPEGARHAH